MTTQLFVVNVSGNQISHSAGRNEATGTHQLWSPAKIIACWTWARDFSYLVQILRTAIPLWLTDMFAVGASLAMSTLAIQVLSSVPAGFDWAQIACWCIAFSVGFTVIGLYPAIGLHPVTEMRLLSRIIVMGATFGAAYDVVHGGVRASLLLWPLFALTLGALTPLARALVRRLVCRWRWWGIQTIVIGAGDVGLDLFRRLNRQPSLGFRPVAIVDRCRPDWLLNDEAVPVGGVKSLEETPELSLRYRATCGILVGSEFPAQERTKLIDALTGVFPQLYITADSADAGRQWSGSLELGNSRLLRVTERLLLPGGQWIKRGIDLAVVILFAPLILPLVCCLALLVKLTSRGPAFYCQSRIGKNGRPIRVWKLRSMVSNADAQLSKYLAENPDLWSDWERLYKLPKDPRITPLGRILRRTSLDEIPQLWNVIRGDMSLVGPRPIVETEISKYEDVYPLYLRVTPGITGLWQINGRNSTTYEERIRYDAEYVRNWSILLDLYILARTIPTVITCDGAC